MSFMIDWYGVFDEAVKIAQQVKEPAELVSCARGDWNVFDVWYNLKTGGFKFRLFDATEKPSDLIRDLSCVFPVKTASIFHEPVPPQNEHGDFVCLHTKRGFLKEAALKEEEEKPKKKSLKDVDLKKRLKLWALQSLGGVTGFNDKFIRVPGFPSPVASAIGGGLLGAGLGRMGGAAVDSFMPEEYGGGDYKRRGMIIGGLLGMAPGAALSYGAFRSGQDLTDGNWMRHKQAGVFSVENADSELWSDSFLDHKIKSRFSGIIKGAAVLSDSMELSPYDMGVAVLSLGGSYRNGYKTGQLLESLNGLSENEYQQLRRSGEYCNMIQAADRIIFL